MGEVSMPLLHGQGEPSGWVRRWSHLIATGGTALDLACGHGRHMQYLSQQGIRALGVDRQPEALAASAEWGETLLADVENGPWPLEGRRFDAVIVTNYLWRPLFPSILQSLNPNGVLIYETFASGHDTVGRPSRPDFLLQPGELLRVCSGLHVVAYENGFIETPPRFVQRIVAIQAAPGQNGPIRHRL